MPAYTSHLLSSVVTTLAVSTALFLLPACGAISKPHDLSSPVNLLSVAVWLEDQCEQAEQDADSATMLEALYDGLVFPSEMMLAVGVVTVADTAWSLYDRVMLPSSEPLPNRPEIVMTYVKPSRAGPNFDARRSGHDVPVTWSGCLSAFRESVGRYFTNRKE